MKKLIFIALFIFTSLGFSKEYYFEDFGIIDLPSGFKFQSERENGKTFVNLDLDMKIELFTHPAALSLSEVARIESQIYRVKTSDIELISLSPTSIGFQFTTPDDNNILVSCERGKNNTIYCVEAGFANIKDIGLATKIVTSYKWPL